MSKKTQIIKTFFAILTITGLIINEPSFAQTALVVKPLSTTSLVEVAQKLFERGEYDEAQTILKRILKSDPDNSPVKRLLKNVESQKTTKAVVKVSRPSDIAADIILIQKNVLAFERHNRDLEFAVRKTLQENMFLYQTLSRRNQDLMALRKKFLGYEVSENIIATTQKTDGPLSTFQDEVTHRDIELAKRNQEIARMMKQVGAKSKILKSAADISQGADSAVNALEWKNDLIEKRSYLVEKAMTLYEKSKDLSILHTELTEVSKSLQQANMNYGQTVKEYEAKIQQLNNVWAQDKAKEQVEIDQLKAQIKNEKVKVYTSRLSPDKGKAIDELSDNKKVELADKAKSPVPASVEKAEKPQSKKVELEKDSRRDAVAKSVETKTKERSPAKEVSSAVTDAQAEIKRLEDELARKEKELNDRSRMFDAKIRELKSGWADQKMALQKRQPTFVPSDDDPFKSSDTYRNLMQELDYLKDQLSLREKEVHKFQNDLLDHTSDVEVLQKKIDDRDHRLADMDALIVTKDQQIAALKKELVTKIAEIREKDSEIENLRSKNVALEGLKDLNKKTVELKPAEKNAGGGESVDKLKGLVAELESSLSSGAAPSVPSKKEHEDIKEQLNEALTTLQEKDREIRSLKSQLEGNKKLAGLKNVSGDKTQTDSKVKDYQDTIDDLKERLTVTVAQRQEAEKALQEATSKLSAMAKESSKTSAGKTGAKDDVAQKINELNRQIQEQSASFDEQLKDLKDQLTEKDAQIADLKKQLSVKEKQVEQFYSTMEEATAKLSTKSVNRGQSPTPTAIGEQSSKPKEASKGQEPEWNPADNDVYSLQQRLDTLSKELKFTQDELTQRTKEKGDLETKINLSSENPSAQKDISKLESELAAFRQQSDLTKATIRLQQESLEKSQKEVDRKERSLKSILDQSDKLRKQIDDYKSTVKEKDEQIVLQQKALDHEIKKNDTLMKKLRDIQKTASTDQSQLTGKNQSMAELKDTLQSYEIRERDFKRQITDIEDQLKASYVMIEDGEKRVAVLKKRLTIREDRIAELQKELDSIKENYKQPAEEFNNQEK